MYDKCRKRTPNESLHKKQQNQPPKYTSAANKGANAKVGLRIIDHYLAPNPNFPDDDAWFVIQEGNKKSTSVNGSWIAERLAQEGIDYIEKHCLKESQLKESFGPWLKRLKDLLAEDYSVSKTQSSILNYFEKNKVVTSTKQDKDRKRAINVKCRRRKISEISSKEPLVGERVYSCFHNGQWYWGVVTARFQSGGSFHYSIEYEDGDFVEDFDPKRGIATESQFQLGLTYLEPNTFLLDPKDKSLSTSTKKSTTEPKETLSESPSRFKSFPSKLASGGNDSDDTQEQAVARYKNTVNYQISRQSLALVPADQGNALNPNAADASLAPKVDASRSEYEKSKGTIKRQDLKYGTRWALRLHFGGHLVYLKEEKKRKEASKFLNAVIMKVHSFRKTKYEVAAMSYDEVKTLIKLAKVKVDEEIKALDTAKDRKGDSRRSAKLDIIPEPEAVRKKGPKIGDRVYSRCHDRQWHWGFVTDKFKQRDSKHYSIKYDNGDFIEDFDPELGIHTADEIGPDSYSFSTQKKSKQCKKADLSLEGAGTGSISMKNKSKRQGVVHHQSDLQKDPHVLIGRGSCEQWTDICSRNRIVFGVITGYQRNQKNENYSYFNVKYNSTSRAVANAIQNECDCAVPSSRRLKPKLAWGACIRYEDQTPSDDKNLPPLRDIEGISKVCWKWIVPDMRIEELETKEDKNFPKLTLVIRGYQLILTVRRSTIPNAGNGVFIKAKNFTDTSSASFVLQSDEMLDLGIYAPLLATDRKRETAFFVKNFIHHYEPEEWCFDTNEAEHLYDMTEDHSGKIHEQARCRIFAYFNECGGEDFPTVHAEQDPEGSVHYLLGFGNNMGRRDFVVNDEEQELFVYYGEKYENVRLRKGYSRLSMAKKKRRLKILEGEDLDYLKDIEINYSAENVKDSVEFFDQLYSKKERCVSPLVSERSLKILRSLEKRCQIILDSDGADDMEHFEGCRKRIISLTDSLENTAGAGSYVESLEHAPVGLPWSSKNNDQNNHHRQDHGIDHKPT